MKLPFNVSDFFNVFGLYNTSIWPLQIVVYLLALYILILFVKKHHFAERAAFYFLAVIWLVNGLGYHLLYFSTINKAAYAFGGLFVLQAFIFAGYAWKTPLQTPVLTTNRWTVSLALASYALLFYSLIGYFVGHQYPNAPIFGVAPCPTSIFTFAILLLASRRLHWYQYLIPLLWAVVGTSAAFALGVREDLGLAVSALIFIGFQFGGRTNR